MFSREKIFNVYEKPEASDPADRVVLLREGFSWGAFLFTLPWLVVKRFWLVTILYLGAATLVMILTELAGFQEPAQLVTQLWLQAMLAYHAYDLQGWWLTHRGYRFAGILVAENEMKAERRYFECVS